MTDRDFGAQWDRHYVGAVRAAAKHAFEGCAHRDVRDAFLVLAWELQRRGIEADPSAVYDAALLISRGRRLAVLECDPSPVRSSGRHLRTRLA
jgi:hypothetical protein